MPLGLKQPRVLSAPWQHPVSSPHLQGPFPWEGLPPLPSLELLSASLEPTPPPASLYYPHLAWCCQSKGFCLFVEGSEILQVGGGG